MTNTEQRRQNVNRNEKQLHLSFDQRTIHRCAVCMFDGYFRLECADRTLVNRKKISIVFQLSKRKLKQHPQQWKICSGLANVNKMYKENTAHKDHTNMERWCVFIYILECGIYLCTGVPCIISKTLLVCLSKRARKTRRRAHCSPMWRPPTVNPNGRLGF